MASHRWLVLALLAGSVLSVGLLASIPIYTDGVLQRLLTRDLERYQQRTGRYPGTTAATYNFYRLVESPAAKAPFHDALEEEILTNLVPALGVPVAAQMKRITLDYLYDVRPQPEESRVEVVKKFSRVEALQHLPDHVTVLHGRMFNPEPVDGVYEAIVTSEAMQDLQLILGRTYLLHDLLEEQPRLTVKVVGVFAKKDPRDLYWFRRFTSLSESFLIDYDTFLRDFLRTPTRNLTNGSWYFALDYHRIRIDNVPNLLRRYDEYRRASAERRVELDFGIAALLEEYNRRAAILKITLSFLHVPIVLVLAFFMYMVSQLIVEGDLAEIAVLESRGAAGNQLFTVYLLQSLLLAAAAMALGPPLALLIVRFLGAANGFLEFVGRTSLKAEIGLRAYGFALAGAAIFLAATLLPASRAARTSIVELRGRGARTRRYTFWRRFYLDLVLIAVAVYGLIQFQQRREIVLLTAASGSDLPLDPLLFLTSVLFILGCAMLSLRLFPYLVRALFRVARRRWSPPLYAAFIQVARARGHEQFLMVFLILTLALGIYNSSAARTVNRNIEERIYYAAGADLTMQPYFPSDQPPDGGSMPGEPAAVTFGSSVVQYREPPYHPYTQIPGLAGTTRVLRQARAQVSLPGNRRAMSSLMAITPEEFGRVAWFRSDLLPVHWNHYLNRLASNPKAMLLSSSIAEEFELKLGDTILVTWSSQDVVDGVVVGFIDHWPTFVPVDDRTPPRLVVANFPYIRAKMATEPYEVWAKREARSSSAEIYREIEDRDLDIVAMTDATQQVVEAKNDPLLQGTNGVLTLGFSVAMLISVVGFVMYWVLTLRSRTLQFGVLRAIGMSSRRVLAMLVVEQVLITGSAIVAGMVIGRVAALLFVPLLQVIYAAADQVPAFRVASERADFVRIYVVAAALLGLGAVLFRALLARLDIQQALKLGEE
ncbi:MAG: ABC transporter permease [Spirochaetaceae bacterium]|nr:ABC transporter permease [Spirochaetaceae bacterium]